MNDTNADLYVSLKDVATGEFICVAARRVESFVGKDDGTEITLRNGSKLRVEDDYDSVWRAFNSYPSRPSITKGATTNE